MARCEECLHFEVCEALEQGNGLMKVSPIHCGYYKPTADVVPKSEVDKLEKESSAFAEIIHKQEDEIQQLRKSLLTKQALEEEFSKSVKKIEKQALKTIEKAEQEVAREIFEEIDNKLHDMAVEYHKAGHPEYFAVCEMVHHKVIRPVEKEYTESEDTK